MATKTVAKTDFSFNREYIDYIRKTFTNPFKFRLMLAGRLPMGFLSGMKVTELSEETCKVTVNYKWLNKNPFRSTFWAVLGMAAEMSSGALLIMYTYKQKPSISTLVVDTQAKYYKKATGKTTFVCHSGKDIAAGVEQAIRTGESVQVICPMTGYNSQGEAICEFSFTWSLKARRPKG
ncbi:MAG: DUF4442 domain-containing protein [Bacteroidota bacterium]